MALPFLAAISVALKTVVGWLLKFILKWLIIQIILTIAVWFASDLIVLLVNILKDEIKKFNNFLLTKIFVVEDLFFRLQHTVYDSVRKIWTGIEARIQSALDSLSPDQLELILKIVNFAAWVDTLITDITKAARDTVISTVEIFTVPIVRKIDSILQTFLLLEMKIEARARELYDSVVSAIQTQVDACNLKITGLFSEINSLIDWFNASILEIRAAVEADNSSLPAKHTEIKAWVLANLHPGTYTESGIADFADSLTSRIEETYQPLAIDFDRYIYTMIPDISNYLLTVIYPAFSFNVTELIPEIKNIRAELTAIRENIARLPADAADRFMQLFPDFFRAQFETRLRQFLVIAITTVLLQKKNEFSVFFSVLTQTIEKDMAAGKAEIIRITKQIIADIEDFQLKMVERLPDVLEPQLKKAVRKLEEQIAKKQDEVLVNVDKYVADTTEIDHIMEKFSAKLKANPNPNKFDTLNWTIQDMYRMLVNYFSREERIALIIYLASQDIEVSTSELEQLFPKPEDSDDPWTDGNPFG